MAINRPIYKINTTSLVPQRTLGISIIFGGNNVFVPTITTKEQVKSNLINFVLTNNEERLFDPTFGGNIRALIFEQDSNVDSISESLKDKILEYVPGVTINDIIVVRSSDINQANLTIYYSIYNQADVLNINITQ
jgi:phage baseplate assembly protein W